MMRSREPCMTAPVRPTTCVIGRRYCAPFPKHLEIVGRSPHSFTVQDHINGGTLFGLSRPLLSLHHRRVLNDAAGNPIVTLYRKIMTAHDRWQVFMGESTEQKDLLFTVKRSNIFQRKTELHVFLANNAEENNWDFKVEGSWSERFCAVHAIESPNIATLMGKKHTVPPPSAFEKDNFIVQVEAEVDHAFIVALIVILDEIN